jgi:hypothetical protein
MILRFPSKTNVKTVWGSKGANHKVELLMICSPPPPLRIPWALLSALCVTFGIPLGSLWLSSGYLWTLLGSRSFPFGRPSGAPWLFVNSLWQSLGSQALLGASPLLPAPLLRAFCVPPGCFRNVSKCCKRLQVYTRHGYQSLGSLSRRLGSSTGASSPSHL